VILSHSARHQSDLIVMASRPHQRFGAAASTIASVSTRAPCAVLTVGSRFQPAPLRRILLPIGATGAERYATDWVTALASRFDAEVGVLRIERVRSGFWKTFTNTQESAAPSSESAHAETEKVLGALRHRGIDAYEIDHPGGSDGEVIGDFCESGAFDAIVMGLPISGDGSGADALAASVRLKTSAPVLSVRAVRSPVSFTSNHLEPLPAVAGADWVQM
jgi:nucleotide-binding universal stress UspA family protein